MAKTSNIEGMWKTSSSKKLEALVKERSDHPDLTQEKLAKEWGYSSKSAVANILNNQRMLPTGKITLAALSLSQRSPAESYFEKPGDILKTTSNDPLYLEAILASFSGRQMPAIVQDLKDEDRDLALSIISLVAYLAHAYAPKKDGTRLMEDVAWPLFIQEVSQVLRGWQEIFEMERGFKRCEDLSDLSRFNEIWDEKWNNFEIFLNDFGSAYQAIYAHVGQARILAQGGVSKEASIHAQRALEKIGSLTAIEKQADEILRLETRAHFILGDCMRALSQYDRAVKEYKHALGTIEKIQIPDRRNKLFERANIKIFNTYVLLNAYPPPEYFNEVHRIAEQSPYPKNRSRALYALAHLERRKREYRRLEKSRQYGEEGLSIAHQFDNNRHRNGIGYQYLGETHLRAGNFNVARNCFDKAIELFRPQDHGRRGYTFFHNGRANWYLAYQKACLGSRSYVNHREDAICCFEYSEQAFKTVVRYRRMSGSGYQRKFLQIERPKWLVLDLFFRSTMEGFPAPSVEEVQSAVDAALDSLLEVLNREQSHVKFEIKVNELLIKLVTCNLINHDHREALPKLNIMEEEATQAIKELQNQDKITQDNPPPGEVAPTVIFEQALFGHLARLYALRGAIRRAQRIEYRHSEADTRASADFAAKVDFLPLLDCRIIHSIGQVDGYKEYDEFLSEPHRQRIRNFMLSGDVGEI